MKIWKSLVLGTILASLLAVTAFASNFTTCAETLSEIGVFKGTGSDFELDRAPTRVEAGIMMVRMLGAEQEALDDFADSKSSHPFTDVPVWADAYIAYLYENGLTTGQTETTFGSGNCTAQQYTTFLLRALGYSDKDGDFTYAEAMKFGMETGVVDLFNCDQTNFLRDHVAAMTLTALATDVKGEDITLFDQLVADGAIAKNTEAGKFLDFYDKMMAVNTANSQSNATVKANLDADVSMIVDAAGTPLSLMDLEGTMDMAMDMQTVENMKMSVLADMTMTISPLIEDGSGLDPVTEMDMEIYLTSDAMYQKAMGETVKIPFNMGQLMTQLETMGSTTTSPICMFSSGSVAKKGTKDVYTMTYNLEVFRNMMEDIGVVEGFSMDDMVMTLTTAGGKLSNMTCQLAMEMEAENIPVIISMNMDADFTKWGTTKVTLPSDLDTYPEMDMTGVVGIGG